MKHNNYILVAMLAAVLALTACNDWLEATSSSQVSDKELFSSRNGFHEALTGVYLAMGDVRAYGGDYTWRVNDLVCCPYAAMTNEFYRTFQQHAFSKAVAVPYLEGMWEGGYHIIANANKALYELESHRDIVTDDLEYNLIKGELLAARAYVHFDLMRMFGLESWTGENASKMTVPYVRDYSSVPEIQRSYQETAKLLLEDIDTSLKCLENDPVRGKVPETFDATINTDSYWTDRQKHLNYYAVVALKARVLMLTGDYTGAYNCASEAVEGAMDSGLARWVDPEALTQESVDDYRDWTFSCEHIFSLEVTNLYANLSPYFFGDSQPLYVDIDAVNNLFIYGPEIGCLDRIQDIRGPAFLMRYTASGYRYNKYYSSNSYRTALRDRVPMIKLSEMYMIMAEVRALSFDYVGAGSLLDGVRSHRGTDYSIETWIREAASFSLDQARSAFVEDLQIEYLKEFLGEGQYLYALKKSWSLFGRSMQSYLSTVDIWPPTKLKYPYPLDEISYGRVQDE